MARKYKIVKVTEDELEFMKKYKVSACTYCSYSVSFIYCNFNGQCPAGANEYLKKIIHIKQKYK